MATGIIVTCMSQFMQENILPVPVCVSAPGDHVGIDNHLISPYSTFGIFGII